MQALVVYIILVALLSAMILLVLDKTEVLEKARALSSGLLFKLLSCDLCMSFWIAVVLSIVSAVVFMDITFVLVPIFSTPITRYLL